MATKRRLVWGGEARSVDECRRRLAPLAGRAGRLNRHGDEVQQEGRSRCQATPTVARRRISRRAECFKVRVRPAWRFTPRRDSENESERGPPTAPEREGCLPPIPRTPRATSKLLKYGSSFIYASAWCFVKDLYSSLGSPRSAARFLPFLSRNFLPRKGAPRQSRHGYRAAMAARETAKMFRVLRDRVCYFAPMTPSIGAWPASSLACFAARRAE